MAESAEEKMVRARLRLLFKHPFFGQLALRMKMINVTDEGWCPTAATDYRNIYYNEKFICALDDDEVVFLIAHELGHCIFEHFIRLDGRIPYLWNIAGDYVINLMLKRENIGRVIKERRPLVPGPLLDDKFAGKTTEEVYDLLLKDSDGKQNKQTLDIHILMDGSGNDDDDENDSSKDSKGNGKGKKLSKNEIKALSDEIRQSILQAAAASAGNLPGEIKRIINNLTESKMNWREHLRATIESSIKSDFSWLKPNRKGWHMNAILPGSTPGEDVEVSIAIDTSGSISQKMLTDFLSEVKGIMDQYDSYKIKVWQFDTKTYGYEEFTHEDGKNIANYQIKGGGGTDFMANWNFMKKTGIEPKQFVMFTDMYPGGSWGDPNYCDTLFVAHGTKSIKAPFGTTTYYS
jgi:predicted metal-dependent peptidase